MSVTAPLSILRGWLPGRRPAGTGPAPGIATFPALGDAPPGTDWVWRPEPWCAAMGAPARDGVADATPIAPDTTLFHDDPGAEIGLRQRGAGAAALTLDAARFAGTFVSLAVELPAPVATTLRRRHVVRVDARLATEPALTVFARLNIRHGPNLERPVVAVPADGVAAFDLAYTDIDERRVEKAWLDLIFETAGPARLRVHDLTLLRHPRAEI